MNMPQSKKNRFFQIAIHSIAWGLMFTSPFFFAYGRNDATFSLSRYLDFCVVPVTFIIVFYINYCVLIDRQLFRKHLGRFILMNLLLIVAVDLFQHFWHEIFRLYVMTDLPRKGDGHHGPPAYFFLMWNFMLLALTVALSVAIKMTGNWYRTEAEKQEIEKERTQAELKNLKSQLNPHFLFNTLNNIYALIQLNPPQAQYAVHSLSHLLRYVLYDNNQNLISLDKEFAFMKNYIELMSLRLSSDQVKLNIDIPDDGRGYMVAPLLFITLIENAFKHGVSRPKNRSSALLSGLPKPIRWSARSRIAISRKTTTTAAVPGSGSTICVKAEPDLSEPAHFADGTAGRSLYVATDYKPLTMAIESLVVDDEPLARDLLAGYVKQTPFLHFAGACSSAVEALTVLQREKIDLIFLDIQMPQLNGLELSRMIGTQTRVVFTTAFEQYALEGFRVDALDYLLKPISYAEFLRAADKAQRWFGLQDGKQEGPVAQGRSAQTLFVKTEYKMVQLRLDQILYIEGVKDYVKIHTEDGASVMTLMSMKAIEETLPADRFVRVHRSFIVHVDKIKTIERNRIVFGKVYIPVSDSYRERFMQLLSRRSLLL